jgi:cysteine desulfurase
VDANAVLSAIKDVVAVSAGAACHSEKVEISHVLSAMNVPMECARWTLRFSTGKMTTGKEIDHALEIVARAVQKLLEIYNTDG